MSFSSQSVKRSLSLSPVGRKKRALFGDRNRANYLVVKTDYTSYSVVYNCNPVGNILKKGNLSFWKPSSSFQNEDTDINLSWNEITLISTFRVTLVADTRATAFTSHHQCWIQVRSHSKSVPHFWKLKTCFIISSTRVMKDYRLPKSYLVNTEQTGCSLLPGSLTK